MFLVNFKNESTTNVSEYYMKAIYLANAQHLCRKKYDLFMQRNWFYRISSFYEKRIDAAEG